MVAGNNKGMVTLLSLEGERIWELKLHKAKCNFVQFSERQPWLVVTTSIASAGRGGSVKVVLSNVTTIYWLDRRVVWPSF